MKVKKHEVVKIIKSKIHLVLFRAGIPYGGSEKLNNLIDKASNRFMQRYHQYRDAPNFDEQHHQTLDQLESECQEIADRVIRGRFEQKIKRSNRVKTIKALVSNALRQCGLVFFCKIEPPSPTNLITPP